MLGVREECVRMLEDSESSGRGVCEECVRSV